MAHHIKATVKGQKLVFTPPWDTVKTMLVAVAFTDKHTANQGHPIKALR